jgi:L,D-peptidoglycan transpeptidase YkuD (ErfK/YbiS/YcfS/YnhG family)
MHILVETDRGLLHVEHQAVPCAIGAGGACEAADKREGDGCTPLGIWPIRAVLLRPGTEFTPPRALPWRWLRPTDGWSDDVADPAYNRPVRHPHGFSAERMWRDDALYDAVLVLGHNDSPPIAGAGSAIFLHLRGDKPTEGCVAIDRAAMAMLLARLTPGSTVDIRRHIGDGPSLG